MCATVDDWQAECIHRGLGVHHNIYYVRAHVAIPFNLLCAFVHVSLLLLEYSVVWEVLEHHQFSHRRINERIQCRHVPWILP